MNVHIELVKKGLADPESVDRLDRKTPVRFSRRDWVMLVMLLMLDIMLLVLVLLIG